MLEMAGTKVNRKILNLEKEQAFELTNQTAHIPSPVPRVRGTSAVTPRRRASRRSKTAALQEAAYRLTWFLR